MTTAKTTGYTIALAFLSTIACGSGDDDTPAKKAGSGGSSASGGTGGGSGGKGGSGGSTSGTNGGGKGGSGGSGGSTSGTNGGGKGGSTSGSGGSTSGSGPSGSGGQPIPPVPGEPCNSVDSALPDKPCMVNVTVQVSGNAADIHFDPVDGAADYRVYELPADGDITASGDDLTIKNAVYRCAGRRMAAPVAMDGEEQIQSGAVKTLVDNQSVNGFKRTLDDATLGYVSMVPGDGLVPVYALGDSSKEGDNSCFFMRWKESRVKQYVTSEDDRDALLEQSFRDDGIVFYVPAADADGTHPVYTSKDGIGRYYYIDGPEADMRQGGAPAFSVFNEAADDRIALMRVFYQNGCGASHDELTPGLARFERARQQQDSSPMHDLHWSGFSGQTTLVVEALADGCPNVPGLLAPTSRDAFTDEYSNNYPAWLTLDDAKALSPAGEVYINGQFDPKNKPRPIARSFVKVKPAAPPELDWFQGFDTQDSIGSVTDEDCGNPISCWKEWRQTTDIGEFHFIAVEDGRVYQSVLGELWVMYDDVAADVNGKFRLTANTPATLSADDFLYATMQVNAFTTARRYPQILISDQQVPVQHNLPNGSTLVIQTFGDWPYVYQLELCDHRTWDVNNQCPKVDLRQFFEEGSTDVVKSLAPNAEVGEQTGVDRSTKFEIWVSTERAYLYLDGAPYGCVNLPDTAPRAGAATVTFGDVLYHSGVDALDWFTYMHENFQYDTRRHFDNLGFKSGVAAPAWDENRLPCVSTFTN